MFRQPAADLQNNGRVFRFSQHGDAPTHLPTVNKSRTGAERRLRDIQDALAEKVASERRPFGQSKENIPLPATPQLRFKSLKGREQRLREIQDALAGLEVVSKTTAGSTTVSTLPTAKRPSESSTPPPTAKRRRLQSSHEAVASVSATSFLPTAVSTTVHPTNHASVSPKTYEKQPEELDEKVHRRAAQSPHADCHIDEFFAQYPKFPYNPRVSVTAEFYRMCKLFGWRRSPVKKEDGCREIDESDRRFRVAREAFNDAIAKQFNSIYGTDLEDISSWKNLCRALGIIPIPKGLQECRDAVAATHVNIVDLVETRTTGEPVKLFRSEEKLSKYTREAGKFFPRDNAYAGGLLRFLLRHILNPSKTRGRRDA